MILRQGIDDFHYSQDPITQDKGYRHQAPGMKTDGLIHCMSEVTLPGTDELLSHKYTALILATGGSGETERGRAVARTPDRGYLVAGEQYVSAGNEPMPSGDGQMSGLISFIIQRW